MCVVVAYVIYLVVVESIEVVYKNSVGTITYPLSRKCSVVGNWCELEVSCKSLPFSILVGWLSYGVLLVPANEE